MTSGGVNSPLPKLSKNWMTICQLLTEISIFCLKRIPLKGIFHEYKKKPNFWAEMLIGDTLRNRRCVRSIMMHTCLHIPPHIFAHVRACAHAHTHNGETTKLNSKVLIWFPFLKLQKVIPNSCVSTSKKRSHRTTRGGSQQPNRAGPPANQNGLEQDTSRSLLCQVSTFICWIWGHPAVPERKVKETGGRIS